VRNRKAKARRKYIGESLVLAEDLGKRGLFLDPHASNLWIKNGIEQQLLDQTCAVGSAGDQVAPIERAATLKTRRVGPKR
jgi:hypothetical protein